MNSFDQKWEQILFALIVLVVAFVLGRVIRMLLGRFFRSAALKLNVDPTRYNFFKNASDFLIYLIAIVIIFRSIPALRAFGDTLLTGAGILAAIVGFASQSAFSNIVSGIFLVIFRPFSVGDRVKIGQLYSGDVEDITLRHTVIKDFENRRIVIPNTVISNEVILNSTIIDEKVCMFIELGISHEANISKAQAIIQEEALKHPYCIDNRSEAEKAKGDHAVMVRVMGFTEVATQLRGYAWARNPNDGFDLKCDLHKSVKERFDREGIALAVPLRLIDYRDRLRNPEANPQP
ncbi:MAG: mechanosensitive ion channel family protein [Cyclobacteriaceae bacterium]|nr:mechanosensitive ion channel family protein [Cyclobacteriaceae bacterium]